MMRRGDIYFAGLDPVIGSEIAKKRPVLVISNDACNARSNVITVIPLTSQKLDKTFPFEVLLPKEQTGLSKDSKAQCHQVRAISTLRINDRKQGSVSHPLLQKLEHALALHLGLH